MNPLFSAVILAAGNIRRKIKLTTWSSKGGAVVIGKETVQEILINSLDKEAVNPEVNRNDFSPGLHLMEFARRISVSEGE